MIGNRRRSSWLVRELIGLVRVYRRAVSPWLGHVCRFEPSCSAYAIACLEGHGLLLGSLLSIRRLCKCHPFHAGGFDPPPPPRLAPGTPLSPALEVPPDPCATD